MTAAATLDQRVLSAITAYFRETGYSPSHHDIARAVVDVAPEHIGRHLRRLADRGLLTFTKGKARSIVLARRGAGLSDDELEREAHARGHALLRSRVAALARAFPGGEDRGIDVPADLTDLLDKLA